MDSQPDPLGLITITLASFTAGSAAMRLAMWRWSKKGRDKPVKFRKLDPAQLGHTHPPTEGRNLTEDAEEELRPPARQSAARYYPRTRNYRMKRK